MYDGSINISTKIDTQGMNTGTKSIAAKMGNILAVIKKIGAALGKVFSIGAIALFGASIAQIFKAIRESISTLFERIGKADELENIKNRFDELKFALANAFLPLLTAALPYVQTFSEWLITLFNKIAMITAALLGQKEVLQVVAGSIKDTGKEIDKSARGALAAFDQLNVLDTQKDQLNTPAQITTEMVPVTQEISDKIAEIRDKVEKLWASITKAWDFVSGKINLFLTWLNEKLQKLGEWIKENPEKFAAFAVIIGLLALAFLALIAVLGLATFVIANFTTIMAIAQAAALVFGAIMAIAFSPITWIILGVIAAIALFAIAIIGTIGWALYLKRVFPEVLESIKNAWQELSAWFGARVLQPLMNGFNFALEWIRSKFESVFSNIQTFVIDILNSIIETINNVLGDIFGGLASGGLALNLVSGGGSKSNDTLAPHIPRLATGAVIPPNAEFAAILGDQRSGTNIETPVELMRQTFDESLARALANQNLTVQMPVYLDSEKIYDGVKKVEIRRGPTLITGGVS